MKLFSDEESKSDIEMAKKGKGDSTTQKKEETKVYQSEDEEIIDYLSGRKVEETTNFDNLWAKKANDLDAPTSEAMNRSDPWTKKMNDLNPPKSETMDRGDEFSYEEAPKVRVEGESKVKPKREKRVFGAKKLAKRSEQEKI